MSTHPETREAEAPATTTDNFTKAVLIGSCPLGINPAFIEAAPAADGTLHLPRMDDNSHDGLRLVGRDGKEHARYIPTTILCYPGALAEIKKYLYGVPVAWVPQGIEASQLTRDRDRKGPLEEALEDFLRRSGGRPSMAVAMGLR